MPYAPCFFTLCPGCTLDWAMHRIMCIGDAKREFLANFVGNAVYSLGQTILDTVQTYLITRNLSSLQLQLNIL